MSRDAILVDPEDGERYSFDNFSTQKWLEGHRPGLDLGADFLKRKAIKLFTEGKHDEAIAMQDLAKEMLREVMPGIEKRVNEHAVTHPFRLGKEDERE